MRLFWPRQNNQITLDTKKLFLIGLLIAAVNPLFAGIITGILFLTKKSLRKEGVVLLIFSLLWGVFFLKFFIFSG